MSNEEIHARTKWKAVELWALSDTELEAVALDWAVQASPLRRITPKQARGNYEQAIP